MTGLGNILAIGEIQQRTEEMILKVRSELYRNGCAPDNFAVERRGLFLWMTYRKQTICTDPDEVLIVLRKMVSGLDEAEIWAQLSTVHQAQTPRTRKLEWKISLLIAGLILAFFLFGGSSL